MKHRIPGWSGSHEEEEPGYNYHMNIMIDEKTTEEYELAPFRRLGCTDLYQQLIEVALVALMDGNRNALALAIASILDNFGVEEKAIMKFLDLQIGKKDNC